MASIIAAVIISAVVGAGISAGVSSEEAKKARDLQDKISKQNRDFALDQAKKQQFAAAVAQWRLKSRDEQEAFLRDVVAFNRRFDEFEASDRILPEEITTLQSPDLPFVAGAMIGIAAISVIDHFRKR